MKKLVAIMVIAVAGLLLAGCGSGKYVHNAGDCSYKNGRIQVWVEAYRDKGVPDSEASQALKAACAAAYAELQR